jgi:hypothetical protein
MMASPRRTRTRSRAIARPLACTPSVSFYLSLDSVIHYLATNKKLDRQIKRNGGSTARRARALPNDEQLRQTKVFCGRRRPQPSTTTTTTPNRHVKRARLASLSSTRRKCLVTAPAVPQSRRRAGAGMSMTIRQVQDSARVKLLPLVRAHGPHVRCTTVQYYYRIKFLISSCTIVARKSQLKPNVPFYPNPDLGHTFHAQEIISTTLQSR